MYDALLIPKSHPERFLEAQPKLYIEPSDSAHVLVFENLYPLEVIIILPGGGCVYFAISQLSLEVGMTFFQFPKASIERPNLLLKHSLNAFQD